MPARVSSRAQLLQRVGGGDVDLDVGLGVEHEPLAGLRRARRRAASARRAEVLGVGEEQRGVVAVDEQARAPARRRGSRRRRASRRPRHVAEDAVVRAGDPAQQVERPRARPRPGPRRGRRRPARRRVVATASTSSLRRNRAIRRNSATSISRSAAKTTRAPSAAVGKRGEQRAARRPATTHDQREGDQRVQLGAAARGRRRSRCGCRCCSPGSRAAGPRRGSRRRGRGAPGWRRSSGRGAPRRRAR